MIKLKLFFLLVLLSLSNAAFSQIRSFNSDPTIFMKELEDLFKGVDDKETLRDFAIFKENWLNGKFTPNQQKFMMQVSNQMLTDQMQVLPYFKLFYGTITRFLERKMPDKTLSQWQGIAKTILANSSEDYLEFLKTTEQLFSSKTLFINENKKWYVDTNNYDIKLVKGKIAIDFGEVTLTCKSLSDKLIISKTKGIYFPGTAIWEGKYGNTDFSRAIPEDKPLIKFGKYTINFNKAEYQIDTVTLIYPKYFKEPILGKFSDKLMFSLDSNTVKTGGYPKFTSFNNNLLVRGIVGSESFFRGGFSMNGGVINTQTVDNKPSFIDIFYKGKKKVTLKSTGFRIAKGVANSPNTEFILYLDSGKNISHPAVQVSFVFKDNRLIINRGDEGLMRTAFNDDYHNMSIDVEQIRWKIDEPFVDFDNINDDKGVKFESNDFFRDFIYEKWQGPLLTNPLEKINAYYLRTPPDPIAERLDKEIKTLYVNPKRDQALISVKLKELSERKNNAKRLINFKERGTFHLDDYCGFFNLEPTHTKHLFIDLHDAGFVNYNFKTDSIKINRKLFKYNLMHKKAIDYDVIRLNSVIAAKPNATLNLLSNEMNIEGVRFSYFSDSQNVSVRPTDQNVVLTQNRNLRFGGMVRAGRFDFYGQRFNFSYEKFIIDFANIDSMQMFYPDEKGERLVPIKSVLRNIGGTLFIDKPNNKSGNINYPEYPIFTSNKGSDILYDKSSIHGGQYKGDVFKFVVDPFTIDSLDNFTIQGLRFEGEFFSDGIFPDFRHYAYIQPDYSLGFVKTTPPGGYPMYRGKGHGDMTMNLSEMGFYGENGEIKYETSSTKFTKILLLLNEAKGDINSYDLNQNAKYPEIHAVNASLNWKPYDDKYTITQGKTPIKMFNFGYDFFGKITQSPTNVIGDGLLKWDLATFSSKEMVFAPKKAKAEVGELTIFALDSTKVVFNSKNIHGTMDFATRMGDFATNEVGQITNFPFNKYQTNLSDYKWNMDKKTIEAKVGPGMGGLTPEFLSTNVTQDSLKFESPKAIYNMEDYTLKAEQVPYIDIADSRLFLKDGKVTIRENANMDTLFEAKLIANRDDKFHEIYKLTIKVLGKNRVHGSGFYQYVDKLAKRQEFLLDSVIVNRKKHVEGIGVIQEERGFTLDKKIGYKGIAQIESSEQLIKFLGFVKPLHTFKNVLPSAWVSFRDFVDPKDVVIPLSNPRDRLNTKQFIGLYIANDSSHVYPLLFSARRRYSDNDVSNDTGILYYDHKLESFMVGSEDKLRNGGTKGSFIQFNEKDHTIHAEGPMDFGLESENIKFKNAGHADLKAKDSTFSFNLAMMLDFPLHKDFVEYLVNKINEGGPGTVDLNTDFFKDALGEMIASPKVLRNAISGIEKSNQLKGKDECDYTLVMSDATFRWDNKMRGMYCNDNVIIASIAGTPINKEVKATMLLESKRSGENMFIYLNYGEDFVFFNITKSKCAIYASDPKLTEILINTANKVKAKDFYIMQTTERTVDKFLKKIER